MKLTNKIKNISMKTWIKITLVSIFLMMLILNMLTPLISDDYSYAIGVNDTRLSGIMDIINYQISHYLGWGGRTVAHSIAQVFLMMPKLVFNISNSFVYTMLIYLIYKLVKEKNKEEKPYLLLGIHFVLYFLTPVFGQTCIWLVGSCNYIWTTTIILLLVAQFILKGDKKDRALRIILMFLLGIIAGWTNENTSFGLITCLSAILIINKINKEKIYKWKISGLIGTIVGFIIMIAAPGNYVRVSAFADNDFILIKWFKRFINCTIGIYENCFLILIALIILFAIYIYYHKRINGYVYSFIIGSLFSVYSMILSPEFPQRSWFGVIIFLTLASFMLIYNLDEIKKFFKPIIVTSIIIVSLIFIVDYIRLAKDIYGLKVTWDERIEIFKNSKDKPIVLQEYTSFNRKSPNYGLIDIGSDKDGWPNEDLALYYNVQDKGIVKYDEKMEK